MLIEPSSSGVAEDATAVGRATRSRPSVQVPVRSACFTMLPPQGPVFMTVRSAGVIGDNYLRYRDKNDPVYSSKMSQCCRRNIL
jgi:hypothetical protein